MDRGSTVVRRGIGEYYDIQIKSSRDLNYIFMQKAKFQPRKNLYTAIVLFADQAQPALYLVPSEAWLKPDALLVSRDYPGKRSKPEWGLNLSRRNLPLPPKYEFGEVVDKM